MICPKCENNIEEGNRFCPNCGAQVLESNSEKEESFEKEELAEKEEPVEREESVDKEESVEREESVEKEESTVEPSESVEWNSQSTDTMEKEESPEEFSSNNETIILSEPITFDSEKTSPAEKEETENPSLVEKNQQEKKNDKKWIGIVAIALVFLGVVAFLILPKLLLNKKTIVEREVATVFTSMKKVIKESGKNTLQFDLEKESLGLSGNIVFKSNYKDDEVDLTKLGNYTITLDGVIDKNANEASAVIDFLKSKKSLVSVKSYIQGNKVLVSLGDLYSKGLTTQLSEEIKDLEISSNQNLDDLEKILTKTEKLIKENIDDKEIKESSVTKEIQGKKEKLTKIEYKMNVPKMVKKVLTGYTKDSEIISILATNMNQTEKDIRMQLTDTIDSIIESEDANMIINYYYKGLGKIREIEIFAEDITLVVDKEGNNYLYSMSAYDEELFTGKYDKEKNALTLETDGITLTLTMKDNNHAILEITGKIENEIIKVTVDFQNKVTSTTQENKASMKISYNDIEASVESNITLEKNKKAQELKMNSTTDIDSLTDVEMEQILSKLQDKLSVMLEDILLG